MTTKSLGQLTIDLIARVGGFEAGMDKAERRAKKGAKGIKDSAADAAGAWRNVAAAAAGAFAGYAIGATINTVIKNTRQMEKEQAQLAAVLLSTGEAAGFSRDQLNRMAAELASSSTLSAGEINKAQTALLAFTGVVGDEFVRAQQAAADMSARTGMSVTQTAEAIGRALDVPSKGMAALSRQGFRFSDEQREIMKHLEATGRTAEAQGIILKALEESYGGAAIAARDTFGGAITALQNTVSGLLTGKEGGLDNAKSAIDDLNLALSDPATAEAVSKLIGLIADGASTAITSIPFLIDAGDGVVRVFSIAADTLVGVFATAAMDVQLLAGSVLGALSILPSSLGGAEFAARAAQYRASAELNLNIANQAADGIREALERPLAGTAMADAARQVAKLNDVKKKGVVIDEASALAEARVAVAAKKSAKEAEKEAKKAADIEKKRAAAIEATISALEQQAETVGMGSTALALYRLAQDGATAADEERARIALNTVAAYEQQREQLQWLAALQDQLSASQNAVDISVVGIGMGDRARQELEEMNAIQQEYARRREELARQQGTPNGVSDEVFRKRIDALRAAEEEEIAIVEDGMRRKLAAQAEWGNGVSAAWQNYVDQAQEYSSIAADYVSSSLFSATSNLSDGLYDFATGAKSAGDALTDMAQGFAQATIKSLTDIAAQWVVSQAVQMALGQAATAANMALATTTAAAWAPAAAMASLASFGANAGPAAVAITSTTALAGTQALFGMAHDGIDSVPKTGTWLLEKGERVTTAETSLKLDRTLEKLQRDQRRSSDMAPIVNITADPARAGEVSTRRDDERWVIDIVVGNTMGDGEIQKAISHKFGVKSVGR